MSNTFTKFIDSCVGAIARKVQDEFDESKHPRDKGGKFSSKGGEGRGAGTSEYDGMDRDEMEQLRSEAMRKQEREKAGSDKFHEYQKQISELTKLINRAKKSEGDPLPDTDFEKEAKKEIGSEGTDVDEQEKSSSGKPMNISVSAGGDTEGLKEEAAEYGVKARIGSSSHGETSVKLSGAKEDIRRYLEEKFYGSEEEAREFSPEAYEESEGSEEDDDADAHSAVKLGSPEHESIRQNYMSSLTGSVPSLDSRVRVKWALDQVDNVIRRFGTESAKNRLMGIVYNVVGLKNSGDKGHVYEQLSDYIKEFE